MRTTRILTNLIAAVGVATTLSTAMAAEPLNIKPGLWEVTKTMTMSGAPLFIEAMNEAQRAEYAKSWAKTVNKPETERDRQCITARDIRETRLFEDKSTPGKQCKHTVGAQTSTAWRATSDCKEDKATNLVELNYAAPAPDRFNGTVKSTMTSPNGKTVIDIRMEGKWIGASCPADEEDEGEDDAED